MNILMAYLTVKGDLSSVILMRTSFGAPSVSDHDGLIGPLSILYVNAHRDCGNVGGMGDIHRVDNYDVGCYIFQTIICYFLPQNSSKVLSYFISVLFSLCLILGFYSI